jgi:RNA polymerase sigma factor (TIGR02999 family)
MGSVDVLLLRDTARNQEQESMKDSQDGPAKVEVTQLLRAWGEGVDGALEQLAPLVENELHRLAHKYMRRERPGQTLQTTALVNEVYLRLIETQQVSWQNRAHFFAISARIMRRILTDFARSRNYLKRGGGSVQVSFDEALVISAEPDADIVAIDAALNLLADLDPRKSQVVELRFFGGLSVEETAEVLKISQQTVMRDWKFAKAWLMRVLSGEAHDD